MRTRRSAGTIRREALENSRSCTTCLVLPQSSLPQTALYGPWSVLSYLSRESNIWKIKWSPVFWRKLTISVHKCNVEKCHYIIWFERPIAKTLATSLYSLDSFPPPLFNMCIILHSGFLLVSFRFSRILSHLFFPKVPLALKFVEENF